MPAYLQSIATSVPRHAISQEFAMEFMERTLDAPPKLRRYLHRIYRHSGIETRHSVIPAFERDGRRWDPGTGERNDLYAAESRTLFVNAARDAVAQCPVAGLDDVTHVITASCTGFYSPGPDYFIARDLGLRDNVQRYHLGFMGCYAAIPALRMAAAFCRADPAAVVLVACVELCSLHIQYTNDLDSILAGAIFADGGAAAVVSARAPSPGRAAFELHDFDSMIVPGTEADMAWRIGDRGFDIVLSTYVPEIINTNLDHAVGRLLGSRDLDRADIATWAVHPGGSAILDKVEQGLLLQREQIAASRGVLRDFGNMSSATLLFVLDRILRAPAAQPRETIVAMAFGPGLTIEAGLLEKRAPVETPDQAVISGPAATRNPKFA